MLLDKVAILRLANETLAPLSTSVNDGHRRDILRENCVTINKVLSGDRDFLEYLLDNLIAEKIFSEDMKETILAERTTYSAASKLLNSLQRRGPDINKFPGILRIAVNTFAEEERSENEKNVQIMSEEAKAAILKLANGTLALLSTSVNDGHRRDILRENCVTINKVLSGNRDFLEYLLDNLIAEKIFSEDMKETILAERTTYSAASKLLNSLQRRGPDINKFPLVMVNSVEGYSKILADQKISISPQKTALTGDEHQQTQKEQQLRERAQQEQQQLREQLIQAERRAQQEQQQLREQLIQAERRAQQGQQQLQFRSNELTEDMKKWKEQCETRRKNPSDIAEEIGLDASTDTLLENHICRISLELPQVPVTIGDEGQIYELENLLKLEPRKNPTTRELFFLSDIRPSKISLKTVDDYLESKTKELNKSVTSFGFFATPTPNPEAQQNEIAKAGFPSA